MASQGERLLRVVGAVCDMADGDEELEMMVCQDDPLCTVVMVKAEEPDPADGGCDRCDGGFGA